MCFANCSVNSSAEQSHKDSVRAAAVIEEQPCSKEVHPAPPPSSWSFLDSLHIVQPVVQGSPLFIVYTDGVIPPPPRYIYMHAHKHTHTRARTHAHTHARTHANTLTHTHTHTHTHKHTRTHTHTHTQTHTHARMHTHTQTHTHARMHTHTHTHTARACQGGASLSSKVRLPSTKTEQSIRSQPQVLQWKWKQSPMPSAGLPREVTIIGPHMPSYSQIQ